MRRRSPWCCCYCCVLLTTQGEEEITVMLSTEKLRHWVTRRRWQRCSKVRIENEKTIAMGWKTQWSTIPGNTSNEKDVRLDDSATITSSNCFRRLGWILDRAVRVSYILVDMIMTRSDNIEQFWRFQFTPEAPVPYLVTSVQAALPPRWTAKRALRLVRWGV